MVSCVAGCVGERSHGGRHCCCSLRSPTFLGGDRSYTVTPGIGSRGRVWVVETGVGRREANVSEAARN